MKIVNHFSNIKNEFSVKKKIFYVDYYFTSHKIIENSKNILCKSFYGETNGALVNSELAISFSLIKLLNFMAKDERDSVMLSTTTWTFIHKFEANLGFL